MKLVENFYNRLAFEKVCPEGGILSFGPGSFGMDFMYEGVKLHLSISHTDNRVWISYADSLATVLASTCDTLEDLAELFGMLHKLVLRRDIYGN